MGRKNKKSKSSEDSISANKSKPTAETSKLKKSPSTGESDNTSPNKSENSIPDSVVAAKCTTNSSKELEQLVDNSNGDANVEADNSWENSSNNENNLEEHRAKNTKRKRKLEKNDKPITSAYVDPPEEYHNYEMELRSGKKTNYIKVKQIEVSLFALLKDCSLAHFVAEDMGMGNGNAEFRRDLKRVDEFLNQREKYGGLAVLEDKGRYIYYLVTKRVSNDKPTMLNLFYSLYKLRSHIQENKVTKIAMPRIGCGLDGLEWSEVKSMIEFVFKNVEIEIIVCNFQPEQLVDGSEADAEVEADDSWEVSSNINDRFEEHTAKKTKQKRKLEKNDDNRKSNQEVDKPVRSAYVDPDKEYDNYQSELRSKKETNYIKVQEIENDLFAMSKDYSLAHCVAEDMGMGSGIAVQFRRDFKRVDELLNQRQKQGGLAVLEDKERYIYYLVTKRVSTGKPTMLTLFYSLCKLRSHVQENKVTKLAMPRIGCGLDRLEWSEVKLMIEFVFKNVDVEIIVCNFQQNYGQTKQKLQQVTNKVKIENKCKSKKGKKKP